MDYFFASAGAAGAVTTGAAGAVTTGAAGAVTTGVALIAFSWVS